PSLEFSCGAGPLAREYFHPGSRSPAMPGCLAVPVALTLNLSPVLGQSCCTDRPARRATVKGNQVKAAAQWEKASRTRGSRPGPSGARSGAPPPSRGVGPPPKRLTPPPFLLPGQQTPGPNPPRFPPPPTPKIPPPPAKSSVGPLPAALIVTKAPGFPPARLP